MKDLNRKTPEELQARRLLQQEAKKPWTLQEALLLIKDLQMPLKNAGFGIALAGSVLLEGESKNDLDLILFPQDTSSVNIEKARLVLQNGGMVPLWYRHEIAEFWFRAGSSDTKHVEVWAWNGHRVDIFFLR